MRSNQLITLRMPQVMDAFISFFLLFVLFAFSLLPLLALQSSFLFRSRAFATVIDNRLHKAEMLDRILS